MTNDAGKKLEGAAAGSMYDSADWEQRVANARARRRKALASRQNEEPSEGGARVRSVDASADSADAVDGATDLAEGGSADTHATSPDPTSPDPTSPEPTSPEPTSPESTDPFRTEEAQASQPPDSVVWRRPLSDRIAQATHLLHEDRPDTASRTSAPRAPHPHAPVLRNAAPRTPARDATPSAGSGSAEHGLARPSVSPEADALYDVIARNDPAAAPQILPASFWEHKPGRSKGEASTSRVIRAVMIGLIAGGVVGALLVKGAEDGGFLTSLPGLFAGAPEETAVPAGPVTEERPADQFTEQSTESAAESAAGTSTEPVERTAITKAPPAADAEATVPEATASAPVSPPVTATEPEASPAAPREINAIETGTAAPSPFASRLTELAAPQPDRPASISPPQPDDDLATLPAATALETLPPPAPVLEAPAVETTADEPADQLADQPVAAVAPEIPEATPADSPDAQAPAPEAALPAVDETVAPTSETTQPTAISAARVYIHAPSGIPQSELDAVSSALRASGFIVESTIRVNLNVSSSNVRYFYGSDARNAGAIGTALAAPLSSSPSVRDFTYLKTQAAPGHIEIWLAGGSRSGSSGGSTTPRATPAQPTGGSFAPAAGQAGTQSTPRSLPALATQPVQQSLPRTTRQSAPAVTASPAQPAAPEPGAVDARRLRNLVETARDR